MPSIVRCPGPFTDPTTDITLSNFVISISNDQVTVIRNIDQFGNQTFDLIAQIQFYGSARVYQLGVPPLITLPYRLSGILQTNMTKDPIKQVLTQVALDYGGA